MSLATPLTDLIFGPSVSSPSKFGIYPLFGPMIPCFFSKTHAPFTIVLNRNVQSVGGSSTSSVAFPTITVSTSFGSGRLLDTGIPVNSGKFSVL